ncbi:hypothetical protein DPEC_G00081480 [Dallia pectoralis]|uniref:Uncharacterized protein n=1 Tax=Dallia pectoralis TaxID=75939 RepID=A0ACC2GYP0_DALPE|nr:hypothetical protein DPEC_G00081480 [Dallia pectoralis]
MPTAEREESEGECGVSVPQREASELGRDPLALPCLKVPRELLRRFPHSKRVGTYLVGKMINKGSFARVMEGLHIGTGEKVAIKVIDKKKARQDSYVLKNMKREPRIHQMVRHPHIVVLLETLETENSYYMVMELCAGGDLMDRIYFGLSNTLKVASVSAELLTTQCGSPAYAAPELLAHRKYGPKVDVWSVGVSMFAMLTGTLPFTVDPFNIKQLHQKMVNREIGSIPNDISKGAVGFVLSLLEPEPSKRPSIRSAMEEKWVNEGHTKRPLHTHTYRNRLRLEDLNQSVLSYMTESLGYSLADVINTLTNNRPSAVLASYHLLHSKLTRPQRGLRCTTKEDTCERNIPSKNPWREKSRTSGRTQLQTEPANEKVSKQASRPRKDQTPPMVVYGNRKPCPSAPSLPQVPPASSPSLPTQIPLSCPAPLFAEEISDEEIGITLFPEVSLFGERELVHQSPSKGPASKLFGSAPCHVPATQDSNRDGQLRPVRPPHTLRTTHSDGVAPDNSHDDHIHHRRSNNDRLEKLQTFYSSEAKGVIAVSPRILLETTEPRLLDREHLPAAMEIAETAPPPLPRVRNTGLKDGGGGKKVTWVGHMVRPSGPPGLLGNGSKPTAFPSQRPQALAFKSLSHERRKRGGVEGLSGGGAMSGGGAGLSGGVKRNSVQLRPSLQRRVADLNLPLLPAALQRPY